MRFICRIVSWKSYSIAFILPNSEAKLREKGKAPEKARLALVPGLAVRKSER
jgi:hypothetical protein